MNKKSLAATASAIVPRGKGILAADESNPTMGKRLAQIGQENTELNRRHFRQALFETAGLEQFISAVILFEETLKQKTRDGRTLPEILKSKGIIPGIKVDRGTIPVPGSPAEKLTQGLDGLSERCQSYHSHGARFAKWRAIITIGSGIPTEGCIRTNADALAKYAQICQEVDLAPIVEPEVLMDGTHTIETCYAVSVRTLNAVFDAFSDHGVYLPGMLLKPNMVIAGKDCPEQADTNQIAEMTLKCLKAAVPEDVQGIAFLSGGQSALEATRNLNAINAIHAHEKHPWPLTFSFGRALQQSPLHVWNGNMANVSAAQAALLHRATMCSKACLGIYQPSMED